MSPLTELPTQAEVWLVDFGDGLRGEPVGRRPAIVLAPQISHARVIPTVTVIPLTRRERTYLFRHPVEPDSTNGLQSRSFAQVEQMCSVNKSRLIHYAGFLDAETWQSIRELTLVYLDT